MEGRCQCGAIRFTTPEPKPQIIYICHCTECRHQSSSSYGITAVFPDFELPAPTPGAVRIYSRPNSIGRTDGYFCKQCGSRLVHKSVAIDGMRNPLVSIKGGCLLGLDKEMLRGAVHIWTKEAIIDVPAEAKQFEGEPPDGSFSEVDRSA